jgi:hypothetical protein
MVAGLQVHGLGLSLKQYLGFALQHDHPLGFVLIVPEVFGAGVTRGHDPFDANVLALYDCFDEFCGQLGWKWGKKVRGQCFAFLAAQHIDGLRSFPCLDGSAVEKGFAKRQSDYIVFPASRTSE